jgi:hypothetical protein
MTWSTPEGVPGRRDVNAGGGSEMCAYITATGSFLVNGGAPVSIAKAEQASAYWSVRPSTASPLICSGDT